MRGVGVDECEGEGWVRRRYEGCVRDGYEGCGMGVDECEGVGVKGWVRGMCGG